MTRNTREQVLLETFETLSDTLIDDYDIVELLHTLVESCATAFDITAAGILLADERGRLEVVASTSEAARLVEVMQLSAYAGPCIDCFTAGQTISVPDISDTPNEWNLFRRSATEQGFRSVYAIPLRLRTKIIGALNLLRENAGELNDTDMRAARALANVATIGIIHERSVRETGIVRDQLQHALTSRVVIEQAKGVLSHTHNISTDDAFELLRDHAKAHQQKLADTAHQVVRLELTL